MKRGLLIVLTLVALSVFITPFHRELAVGDETKYSQIVREMRESGELIVPSLNGRPYTHKPPVHFWVITALTYVFGFQSTWPYVLQSLIAHLLTMYVGYKLAREHFREPVAAYLVPIFYGTAILAWGIAQTARMDPTFNLFVAIAMLYLHRFTRGGSRRQLYAAAALLGVAILIKGPMAVVIALVALLFEKLRRISFPRTRAYWLALLVVAAIPMLWLVPAIITGGADYADELLVKQNVGRAVNSWVHKQPPWYYLLRSPLIFFPVFFVAVPGIVAIFRRSDIENGERDFLRYCVSWIAGVVVPFSFLSGKLDVYMLPALLPLCLIGARFVAAEADDRLNRGSLAAVRVVIVGFTLLMLAAPFIGDRFLKGDPEDELVRAMSVKLLFWTVAAIGIVAASYSFGARSRVLMKSAIAMSVVAIAPLVYLSIFLMPLVNELSSTRPLIRALSRLEGDPSTYALYYTPHLWSRSMPPGLLRVRYIDADGLDPKYGPLPQYVATRASRRGELGPRLGRYEKVDEVRMIRKEFHVYRLR